MTLEELKQLPHGTQLDSIILVIKTARKAFQVSDDDGDQWWQEVVFMDVTGEMPGEILIGKYEYKRAILIVRFHSKRSQAIIYYIFYIRGCRA